MRQPLRTLLHASCGLLALFSQASGEEAKKMNVIFILADDLGWSDTTLFGTTRYYKNPNLERLAKKGLTFSRAYSASPLCSPTRSSILTGLSPARTGITAPVCHTPPVHLTASLKKSSPAHSKSQICESATRLNTTYFTLPEALKEAGYATGHFGKWHLGAEPFSPLQQGFDVDLPHWPGPGPAGSYVAPWRFKDFDPDPATPNQHIEDRMANEAVAFMEKHKDEPFFLNYWMFSVHAPFDAKKKLIEKYQSTTDPSNPQHCPTYAAMVESMDDAIGTLLDAVDRLGISDRTAIIFTSDNGGNMYSDVKGSPPTSNLPLRGGKATMFEGGVRVPCIVHWPKLTTPATRSDAIIQSSDFYPTLLELLRLKPKPNQSFDGISIAPALSGKPLARKGIFTYFPHSPPVPDHIPPAVSLTEENWKLIRIFNEGKQGAHAYLLYQLKSDPGETTDVSAQNPAVVKDMDARIGEFLTSTSAVVPGPNPDFSEQALARFLAQPRKAKGKKAKPEAEP